MIQLKLLNNTYNEIRSDLARIHPYAKERVGFALVRKNGDSSLIVTEYISIPDEYYLVDNTVGARIDHRAIVLAMKEADRKKEGILHIHEHPGTGVPKFSSVDLHSQPDLLRSFRNANPLMMHGFLLFSENNLLLRTWQPRSSVAENSSHFVVVGQPVYYPWERRIHGNNRQSFLGDYLDDILENCTVGVVGLGGGGSQIVQELAHIGFQRYVLCDFDTIEKTNLNRLVGSTQTDVENKSQKLSIAVRLIQGIRPTAKILEIPSKFQDNAELLKRCDILFGCLDGYKNRRELEVLARTSLIPYIDIGMDIKKLKGQPPRMGGQVIASVPSQPCMWCFGYLTSAKLEEEAKHYGDTGPRPQVIWPNSILASTAVHIGLNLLTDWTGQAAYQTLYYGYDGNTGELTPHPRYLRQRGQVRCPHFDLRDAGDRNL